MEDNKTRFYPGEIVYCTYPDGSLHERKVIKYQNSSDTDIDLWEMLSHWPEKPGYPIFRYVGYLHYSYTVKDFSQGI